MLKEIELHYGEGYKTIRIPEKNIAWVIGPKDIPQIDDIPAAISNALRSPINSPPLPDLIKVHGKKTVILVDDNTRSTPQDIVLPILLKALNGSGVADEQITVLIALGTHRPMTADEILERFGEEVVSQVKVINLPQSDSDFEDFGVSELGTPIHISKKFLESDMSIAVGNIIPHMYAGWAGGAKMIQPGITSHDTTAQTHLLAGPRVYEILGTVDNAVRAEMEIIAEKAGLKFILNFVLNSRGEVVGVVAGHFVDAHRAGVEIAKQIYLIELSEKPDIVIASSHPADRDLWQGFKAVNNCGMLVKDGGTLIVLSPYPEGISPDHPQIVELGATPCDEVIKKVEAGEVTDGVSAATYLALDQTRRRISIELVSDGIDPDEARSMCLGISTDVNKTLEEVLRRHGNDARIGIVTAGADIMGIF